jgi:tetratricopeptide (TPR) repeat protein
MKKRSAGRRSTIGRSVVAGSRRNLRASGGVVHSLAPAEAVERGEEPAGDTDNRSVCKGSILAAQAAVPSDVSFADTALSRFQSTRSAPGADELQIEVGKASSHLAVASERHSSSSMSYVASDSQPLLIQALEHIKERRWAEAQRALEVLLNSRRNAEAERYLAEVRSIRRCLRQLRRWTRDALLHSQLGWLYFGLELGGEAAAAFERAVELDPGLAEAHHGLALEYLFQNKVAAARRASAQAHALNPELPSFAEVQRALERAGA